MRPEELRTAADAAPNRGRFGAKRGLRQTQHQSAWDVGNSRSRKSQARMKEHLNAKMKTPAWLTDGGHAARNQIAAILQVDAGQLAGMNEEDIRHYHRVVVARGVGYITDGLQCETKLMGHIEVVNCERETASKGQSSV